MNADASSRVGLIATVYPSRAAQEEAAGRMARENQGLALLPPAFTWESLLPWLLDQAPLEGERRALDELAGALLTWRLLREKADELGVYQGLAAGRRLPLGLWRLMVELKAAGLNAGELGRLAAAGNPRLAALARLMGFYQGELDRLGLADQADRAARLEGLLQAGRRTGELARWSGLIARQVLWLRPLDIRMVRALSQVMPVRLEFCLTPGPKGLSPLHNLLDATARALEADGAGDLTLHWSNLADLPNPLAPLAAAHLEPGRAGEAVVAPGLELARTAGRYGLAEAMARRALELLESGVSSQDVVLVFPSLETYGPMLADAARRLGLPLAMPAATTLADAPLVSEVLSLLELPLLGFPRRELCSVLASPYLSEVLSQGCLPPGGELPRDVEARLAKAGYVDQRATPWAEAGQRLPEKDKTIKAIIDNIHKLDAIKQQGLDLKDYCSNILRFLEEVDPAQGLAAAAPGAGPPAALILSRDLAALAGLRGVLASLAQADATVAGGPMAPARLLALLREVLARTPWRGGRRFPGGVRVLTLAESMGLSPAYALVGGLGQSEFPRRPTAQHLLSSPERLALGKRAKQPVWRTDQEEYTGQVLRMTWLLASCGQGAWLGASAADSSGREEQPSFFLQEMATLTGRDLPQPHGGVYGDLPALGQCRDLGSLRARLAATLCRPGPPGDDPDLAQAALWRLLQEPGQEKAWQSVALRAHQQQGRLALDRLPPGERPARADAFSGLLAGPGAAGLLTARQAQPTARRLSPSSLEAYAACPQAWFFSYVLGLFAPRLPGWEMESFSEGQWVHRALALLFDPTGPLPAPEDLPARLPACLAQARDELRQEGHGGHPAVWTAREGALLERLIPVAARELAEMDPARPALVERGFGQEDGLLPLAAEGAEPVWLCGRLDRLDRAPGLAVVTDYKHSHNMASLREAVKPELLCRTAFQLPVYLAAAAALVGEDVELKGRLVSTWAPAEPARELKAPPDLITRDPARRAELAAQGEANLFNAVDDIWRAMGQGRFVAAPQVDTCRYCDYAAICRANPVEPNSGEGEA